MKGPVPTGFLLTSSPYLAMAAGLIIRAPGWATVLMKAPKGSFRTNLTVDSSRTTSSLTGFIRLLRFNLPPIRRAMFTRTASALKAVPSWNLMPLRSLKVNSVAVLLKT